MNKTELKLQFDEYLMNLKKQAFKLIEENNYDNILEVMQDCVLDQKTEKKPNLSVIYGHVDKKSASVDLGEGEFFPIFTEEEENE